VITNVVKYQKDCYSYPYNGLEIKTNKRDIYIIIEQGQFCCETYDVVCFKKDNFDSNFQSISQNDCKKLLKKFKRDLIGKKVSSVEWNHSAPIQTFCDSEAAINIHLENGTLVQLLAYNDHNGYYTHSIEWNLGYKEETDSL
jgi:hypothetical protein